MPMKMTKPARVWTLGACIYGVTRGRASGRTGRPKSGDDYVYFNAQSKLATLSKITCSIRVETHPSWASDSSEFRHTDQNINFEYPPSIA